MLNTARTPAASFFTKEMFRLVVSVSFRCRQGFEYALKLGLGCTACKRKPEPCVVSDSAVLGVRVLGLKV